MRRQLLVVVVLAVVAGSAWGQAPPEEDQKQVVKALLERLEILERRVGELEAKQGTLPDAPPAGREVAALQKAETGGAIVPPGQTHDPQAHDNPGALPQLDNGYPSLHIRGFADVDFSATDQKGVRSGFNLGQFDLHLASALSRKISFFGEVTFNPQPSTNPPQPSTYAIEVERSIIRYDYNNYFKLSFGRFHTPVGYWNTAFHHGAWLQTTIARPEIVKVGGTFIPVHFVGLLAEGNIPSGGVGLGYNVGVGNGRASIISRAGDAGDNNNNRAWVVNLFARPAKFYGLQVGGSVYRDQITLFSGRNFSEWITSAHLIWTKETPEFLAEFANVHHTDLLTNLIYNSQGLYVQTGYRLPSFERILKPYFRFEYIHSPKSEPVLNSGDLVQSILGIRYDISSFAAFKTEYRNTRRQPGEPHINGLFLQTAFTF